MPISSLIVRTGEPDASRIVPALEAIGAVTSCDAQGPNIIVITETDATSEDEALWKTIEGVEGVVAVELIYHNFEDLEK